MTDLFDPKHDRGTACTDAARMLLPLLGGQTKLSRRDLNEAMVHAFGGSDAEPRNCYWPPHADGMDPEDVVRFKSHDFH